MTRMTQKKEETRCNGNYKTTWHRKQQTTCDHVICKELKLNNTTTNEEKKNSKMKIVKLCTMKMKSKNVCPNMGAI